MLLSMLNLPALKSGYSRLQGNKLSLNVVKTQAIIIGSSQKLRKIDTPYGTDSSVSSKWK